MVRARVTWVSSPRIPAIVSLIPGLTLMALGGAAWTRRASAGEGARERAAWWATLPFEEPAPPRFGGLDTPSQGVGAPGAVDGVGPAGPIDAYILEALGAAGLAPAPPAERGVLVRRLYFDLIGLPPSPQEVREVIDDPDPLAWERLVDRLLASPRHGERWARHWMDVAHFAETHGHDQDRIRENAWPYRDYLIRSFNADKPYARFVKEQVAGDVLYPDDPDAVIALGFLAAGPWDESSLRDIREDSIDRQIGRVLDRDDVVTTVMTAFTSVTVHCARCHDHKFDPIPSADYYALQAVFAGVDRANRRYEPDPAVGARRRALAEELRRVEAGDEAVLKSEAVRRDVEAWKAELGHGELAWHVLEPEVFVASSGAPLARQADGSVLAGGDPPDKETYTITIPAGTEPIGALRLEVLEDSSLPMGGPGRAVNGNLHLSEISVSLLEPGPEPSPGGRQGQALAIRAARADFDQEGWTIAHAIDGREETAWGIHPREGAAHVAIFELSGPISPRPGSRLVVQLHMLHGRQHVIGRWRLSAASVAPAGTPFALPRDILAALRTPEDARSETQYATLARAAAQARIRHELEALPPPALVYAAASEFEPDGSHKPAGHPRPIHILYRGDIHSPRAEALPGALSCLAALPARFDLADPSAEGGRRAALAAWLIDPRNPLTWRSIANRLWQHHLGRGLVGTPSDFGRMGERPTHPALLDWLALRLRDEGGSLKRLHRAIVSSDAYRRDVAATDKQLAIDPENRLLGRWSRQRLEAECVHDAVLAISGDLDLRMGGPSDRNFGLSPGVHVTPVVDYASFDPGSPASCRRSVYRFLFRTLPDPWMEALDCPAGDQWTAARVSSVTVQQALALWNSAFLLHQSERFAERIATLAPTLEEQVPAAFELAIGRLPRQDEQGELVALARELGLAALARVIFNLNELIFVN